MFVLDMSLEVVFARVDHVTLGARELRIVMGTFMRNPSVLVFVTQRTFATFERSAIGVVQIHVVHQSMDRLECDITLHAPMLSF